MAETFFYMETIGRVTGEPHKIEIWFVEYDGCYYLCSEKREQADWVQNIQSNPEVTYYTAQGKSVIPDATHDGVAQIVDNEATINAVKPLFDAKYNWSNGLFVQICPK